MTPAAKAKLVKTLAREAGFDLAGISRAEPLPRAKYYREWVAAGHGGRMRYLARYPDLRSDPRELLSGARTIVSAAVGYKRSDGYRRKTDILDACRGSETAHGRIAQYARGVDYHVVLRRMLETVVANLKQQLGEDFAARTFVDTGPLLERELAAAAGLGWIGRNTCLLHPHWGSYLLLGEIVTTLDLPPDEPLADRCGSCSRCVDTCPTGALVAPYQMDARRCISYLTIEHRAEIAADLARLAGDWVFGCDICQQVCPYNARAPRGRQPEVNAERRPARVELLQLLRLRSGEYRRLTRGSALRRAKRAMWRRNAAVALGNVGEGDAATLAALREAAHDDDPALRAAAAVAWQRLQSAT